MPCLSQKNGLPQDNIVGIDTVIQIFSSQWTYRILKIVGLLLLAFYFSYYPEFSFSIFGVIGYVLLSVAVSATAVGLNFSNRFPALNQYLCASNVSDNGAWAEREQSWVNQKSAYLREGLRGTQMLFSPAEDGLVCVPVLLIGIDFVTSTAGGVVFGLIHLGRFTYLECLGKAIIYTLACFFILPYGILNIIFGHFAMNVVGFVILKLAPQE
jgi:hypothetical protein